MKKYFLILVFTLSLGLVTAQTEIPTPTFNEIKTSAPHVTIKIIDYLDLSKLELDEADRAKYKVYLFVHPLTAYGWWKQMPSSPSQTWIAQAQFGSEDFPLKDGDVFQVAAILAPPSPPDKVGEIEVFKNKPNVYQIGETRIYTIVKQ